MNKYGTEMRTRLIVAAGIDWRYFAAERTGWSFSKERRAMDMGRDSAETRARLIGAVGKVLAREGFQNIGVNSVAREAGVDKVLIYRYFKGLKELVLAFCRSEGFWPSPLEIMGGDREAFAAKPYAEQLADCAVNFLRALRSRPLAREVLAWRFLVKNELTEALDAVRGSSWAEVLRHVNAVAPDSRHDVEALQAIVGAAVNHLGSRAGVEDAFAGIDLTTERGWERIESTLRDVCRAMIVSNA